MKPSSYRTRLRRSSHRERERGGKAGWRICSTKFSLQGHPSTSRFLTPKYREHPPRPCQLTIFGVRPGNVTCTIDAGFFCFAVFHSDDDFFHLFQARPHNKLICQQHLYYSGNTNAYLLTVRSARIISLIQDSISVLKREGDKRLANDPQFCLFQANPIWV